MHASLREQVLGEGEKACCTDAMASPIQRYKTQSRFWMNASVDKSNQLIKWHLFCCRFILFERCVFPQLNFGDCFIQHSCSICCVVYTVIFSIIEVYMSDDFQVVRY